MRGGQNPYKRFLNNNIMKVKLLVVILLLCVIPIVSSAEPIQHLGTFKNSQDIEILQICSNETSLCSFCNISSIKYPNSSIIVSNIAMTNRGADFNYTLTSGFTTTNGIYSVNGYCGTATEVRVFSYEFTVTPNGEPITTGKTLFYLGLFSVAVLFLFVSLANIGRYENYSYNMMFVALTYLFGMGVLFIGWQISENFLTSIPFIANILYVMFLVAMICLFPFIIGLALYLLAKTSQDKQIGKLTGIGYTNTEAQSMVRNRGSRI